MTGDEYEAFRRATSAEEREAIKAWLSYRHRYISGFERTGQGDDQTQRWLRDLDSALKKAVVCKRPVYRGLLAEADNRGAMDYLRQVISGPEPHVLQGRASSSYCRWWGEYFAWRSPDAKKHALAVLIVVQPLTARHLSPFKRGDCYGDDMRDDCDEMDVVLIRGSRYRRTSVQQVQSAVGSLECWQVAWQECDAQE